MAACVRSRENSASRRGFTVRAGAALSPGVVRASSSRMADSRSPRSCRISAAKHFSSRSKPKQQMFGADVFVREPFRFFRGISQHALAFVA